MRSARAGFTLIETLVGTAVLIIFFAAVTIILQTLTTLLGQSRVRVLAQSIALNRLEEIRNLPYAQVGTVGGIPQGFFSQVETVNLNGLSFQIETQVIFVDDPFDGVMPADLVATDFKRAQVRVSATGIFANTKAYELVTDVVPAAAESEDDGGTLSIRVVDALGQPVSNANVKITSTTVTPAVNLNTLTDNEGKVVLPGAKPGMEEYQIEVTKTGYTVDKTYSRSQIANPVKPHLSVLDSQISSVSFVIDRTSTINFRVVRNKAGNFGPFNGVQFRVHGSKEIGRTDQNDAVYKYDQHLVSPFSGTVTVANMEWDTYTVDVPTGSIVDLSASWPLLPYSLLPGSNATLILVMSNATPNSLWVRVRDSANAPIASASVELSNPNLNYIATQSTGLYADPDRAQTFFANLGTTLKPFKIRVGSPGLKETVTEATISGNLVEELLLLP